MSSNNNSMGRVHVEDNQDQMTPQIPMKLSTNDKKKIAREKARIAKEAYNARKLGGEVVKPRKDYTAAGQLPTTPRETRRKAPYNTVNYEYETDGVLDDKYDGAECTPQDALQYFTYEWLTACPQPGESDFPMNVISPINVVDVDYAPFSFQMDNWVTKSRDFINDNPFRRDSTTLKKMQIFNLNWKTWIAHKSAKAIMRFFQMSGTSKSDGSQKSVSMRRIFDAEDGVMEQLSSQFASFNSGPCLPLPPVNVTSTPESSSNDESEQRESPPPRATLTERDPPFNQVYRKGRNLLFGRYNGDQLIHVQDMQSIVTGQWFTTPAIDVLGEIVSEKSRRVSYGDPIIYIPTLEFCQAISPNDDEEREIAKSKIKSRLEVGVASNGKRLNRVGVTLNSYGHFVLALVDTTIADVTIYDPLVNGGTVSLESENERDQEICETLMRLGSLMAELLDENQDHWIPFDFTWHMVNVPFAVGVQTDQFNCGMFVILYLELLGGLLPREVFTDALFFQDTKMHDWDTTRKRYFNFIVDSLSKQKQLCILSQDQIQPQTPQVDSMPAELPTPITELAHSLQLTLGMQSPTFENETHSPPGQILDDHLFPDEQISDLVKLDSPLFYDRHGESSPPLAESVVPKTFSNKGKKTNVTNKKGKPFASKALAPSTPYVPETVIRSVKHRKSELELTELERNALTAFDDESDAEQTNVTHHDAGSVNIRHLSFRQIRKMGEAGSQLVAGGVYGRHIKLKFKDVGSLEITANGTCVDALGFILLRKAHSTPQWLEFSLLESPHGELLVNNIPAPSRTGRENCLFNRLNLIRRKKRALMPYWMGGSHWALYIFEYIGGAINLFDPCVSGNNTAITSSVVKTIGQRMARCLTRVMAESIGIPTSEGVSWTASEDYVKNPFFTPQTKTKPIEISTFDNSGLIVLSFMEYYIGSEECDILSCQKLYSSTAHIIQEGAQTLKNKFLCELLAEFTRPENRM